MNTSHEPNNLFFAKRLAQQSNTTPDMATPTKKAKLLKRLDKKSVTAIVIAVIVFTMSLVWASLVVRDEETVPALVAARNLNGHRLISENDVKVIMIPRKYIPDGALNTLEDYRKRIPKNLRDAGRDEIVLTHPVAKNQIITTLQLGDYLTGIDGYVMRINSQAYKISADWSEAPLPRAKVDETVSITATATYETKSNTIRAIQKSVGNNIRVLNVKTGSEDTVEEITLEVSQEQSRMLSRYKSMGYDIVITLNGTKVNTQNELDMDLDSPEELDY